MDLKIILFGCGKIGSQALRLLGKENIACFVDNHKGSAKTIEGIPILAFEEYRRLSVSSITILSMGQNASAEVAM